MRQKKQKPGKRAGFSEDAAAPYDATAKTSTPTQTQQIVELGAGGRLVIPAPMRTALGMKVGDRLTVRLEGDELRIHTFEAALRRIQEHLHRLDPKGQDGVDAFLAERRRAAAKEEVEFGDD